MPSLRSFPISYVLYYDVAPQCYHSAASLILGVLQIGISARIMPLKRLKKKSIKRLVEKRVAKAIDEYEKTKANLDNAGSSGGENLESLGELVNVQGFFDKTFMKWKTSNLLSEQRGVVGFKTLD
ncbi:hypothetical protein Tco_0085444 [Tanacetum coccineum]